MNVVIWHAVLLGVISGLTLLASAVALLSLNACGQWSDASLLLGAGIGGLIAFRPQWGLALALFLLPLLGNRPSTSQALGVVACLCLANFGLSLRLLGSPSFRRQLLAIMQSREICLLWFLSLATILSLSGYPVAEFIQQFTSALPSFSDSSSWAFRTCSFLSASETTLDYPLLATFLWFSGFQLALLAALYLPMRVLLLSGLSGLLLALAAGFLDYYGAVSLAQFRALDPVVNPGDVQFRMQSFFGHSGWFAEYITLLVPSVLVLLTLRLRFWTRVALIISILVIGEFALVLTFQRGGWLSYPLTLLVVWMAIYLVRLHERGELNPWRALRKSAVKIAVCFPLTIVLSLGLLWLLGVVQSSQSQQGIMSYAQRFQDVARVSDRSGFMRAGYLLGLEAPALGLGAESFGTQYQRFFENPESHLYREFEHPLHGTAHNVYFQTFAGKGLVGLLLLIAILFSLIVRSFRFAFHKETAQQPPYALENTPLPRLYLQRLYLLASGCFAAAFFIYGHVQEIFYIFALLAIVMILFGSSAALLKESEKVSGQGGISAWYMILSLMLLCAVAYQSTVRPGVGSFLELPDEFGCFAVEATPEGEHFRWCGPRSAMRIPVEMMRGDGLRLEAAPSIERAMLFVSISAPRTHEVIRSEFPLSPSETILISRESLSSLLEGIGDGEFLLFSFRIGSATIPARDFEFSRDTRALAFRLWHGQVGADIDRS